MKKVLVLIALIFLIMITTSCQKPEEITLSKYFQAMKAKDRDTMAAMASEPVSLEFKSWELVSSEAPVSEEFGLPKMIQELADVRKKKDDQILLVKDKKDALDQLKTKLSESRGAKKAEVQKQITAMEAEVETETAVDDEFPAVETEALTAAAQVPLYARQLAVVDRVGVTPPRHSRWPARWKVPGSSPRN